jgi:hypothetical protein
MRHKTEGTFGLDAIRCQQNCSQSARRMLVIIQLFWCYHMWYLGWFNQPRFLQDTTKPKPGLEGLHSRLHNTNPVIVRSAYSIPCMLAWSILRLGSRLLPRPALGPAPVQTSRLATFPNAAGAITTVKVMPLVTYVHNSDSRTPRRNSRFANVKPPLSHCNSLFCKIQLPCLCGLIVPRCVLHLTFSIEVAMKRRRYRRHWCIPDGRPQ